MNVGGPSPLHHTFPDSFTLMTTQIDVQAEQSPCSLTDHDLQEVSGGLLLPPGSAFPTSDPDSSLPPWWMFLL